MSDAVLLVWLACGAIGGYAAHVRGWSVVAGVLAGILLGPFAVLLFVVSGVFTAGGRTCPECAEQIKLNAKVCRFCRAKV